MVVLPGSAGDPYWNSSCSGCTDPAAFNYDANATIDDGSCEYSNMYAYDIYRDGAFQILLQAGDDMDTLDGSTF